MCYGLCCDVFGECNIGLVNVIFIVGWLFMLVILFSWVELLVLIFVFLCFLWRWVCFVVCWVVVLLEEEMFLVMCVEFLGEKWEVVKRVFGSGEGVMG